ncbi:membrane protein [Streptomyces flavofungini]|nr:membrane protein [Streptomyces flavofungini]
MVGSLGQTLRSALPALAGYVLVRAVSLGVLAVWAHVKHRPLMRVLVTWDSGWYLMIAREGYDRHLSVHHVGGPGWQYNNLAFFPLYPYAMRALHTLSPWTLEQAGLVISWTSALAAAWGIYAVAEHLYSQRVGILAAALWGTVPAAVVTNMAYTEALFTALCAWSLYAALTGHWIWAGALSFPAGLTRAAGAAVVVAVMAAGLIELWNRRQTFGAGLNTSPVDASLWRLLAGVLLAPLGLASYLGWVAVRLGTYDGYFQVQKDWGATFDVGAGTAHQIWKILASATNIPLWYAVVTVGLCIAVVLLVVSAAGRQPAPLLIYSALNLTIAVGVNGSYMSRLRFLLPAFPLLFPLAMALARVRTPVPLWTLLTAATATGAVLGGHLLLVYPLWP